MIISKMIICICRLSLFVVICCCLLFVVVCLLSFVVVCHLPFVVVCRLLLVVVCHCLLFVAAVRFNETVFHRLNLFLRKTEDISYGQRKLSTVVSWWNGNGGLSALGWTWPIILHVSNKNIKVCSRWWTPTFWVWWVHPRKFLWQVYLKKHKSNLCHGAGMSTTLYRRYVQQKVQCFWKQKHWDFKFLLALTI